MYEGTRDQPMPGPFPASSIFKGKALGTRLRVFETRKWVIITKEFLNVFQELWCGLNVRLFRRYLHHPVPHWVVPLSLVNETDEKIE